MNNNNLVVKANKLITSRYELSLEEQRIILTVVSMLDSRTDKEFESYEIKIKEFAELVGIDNPNYYYIQQITKKLANRVVEIREGKKLIQTHWVSSFVYEENKGTVEIRMDNILKPYLLQLKEHFTKYQLTNILQMKSKYGIRIYELMKLNEYKGEFEIDFEELKYTLYCDSYTHFSNFMRRVVDPAINEINNLTDIFVVYEVVKRYGKPNIIKFNIIKGLKAQQTLYNKAKQVVEANE